MQEGVVGLLRARERYDPERGTPFWAYATWWVRQSMQRLVAELDQPVVLSDRALRQLARVKDAQHAHLRAHGVDASTSQLAAATGFARAQVDHLVVAGRVPRAVEEPLGGEDVTAATIGDLLADPLAEEDYDGVLTRMEAQELERLLDDLTERERTVVRGRFGFDGSEQTLREIAGPLGVSAERVRQIEEHALDKLRAATAAQPPGARSPGGIGL
jgi:RNA polymerase sigma factor (sigma-70 family)